MVAKRDYYDVLGVTKTSSHSEVKQQYRKLALKFHPDRNQYSDDGAHFKEIFEAYAVISDPEKKQIYDQHGHAGVNGRYSSDDIFRGAQGGDLILMMYGDGVTKVVLYIFLVNTMKQSNVMIRQ